MTDSQDELRQRFNKTRDPDGSENTGDQDNTGDSGNIENTGDKDNRYDWGNKYNYPFYVPREFADELDRLYNQYDGKNKVEGGDGLEKHREFLFPIMKAAVEELDLEEVVDWKIEE